MSVVVRSALMSRIERALLRYVLIFSIEYWPSKLFTPPKQFLDYVKIDGITFDSGARHCTLRHAHARKRAAVDLRGFRFCTALHVVYLRARAWSATLIPCETLCTQLQFHLVCIC